MNIEEVLYRAVVSESKGCNVLCIGENGSGKSTVLSNVLSKLGKEGYHTIYTSGELGKGIAFGSIREGIKNFREKIGGISVVPMALSGINLDVNVKDRYAGLEGLLKEIKGITKEYSPLVIGIDDIDEADKGTIDFIAYLTRVIEGMGVYIIATASNEEGLAKEINEEIQEKKIKVFRIPPLSRDEIIKILDQKGISWNEELLNMCEGNIGKAIKLANAGKEEQYTEEEKKIIEIMSIMNGKGKYSTLVEIIKIDESKLVESIENLTEKGLIKELAGDNLVLTSKGMASRVINELSKKELEEYANNALKVLMSKYKRGIKEEIDEICYLYGLLGKYHEELQFRIEQMKILKEEYDIEDEIKVGEIIIKNYNENTGWSNDEKKLITETYINMGDCEISKGNIEEGINYYQNGLKIANEIEYYEGAILIHIKIGHTYFDESEYDKANKEYSDALKIGNMHSIDKYEALIYNYIGHIYEMKGANKKAMEYYNKALNIAEIHKDEADMAHSYHRMGTIYYYLNDFKKAEEYLNKALRIRERLGLLEVMGHTLNNLGIVENVKGNYDKSMEYYLRYKAIADRISNMESILTVNNNISAIYVDAEEYDKAEKMILENIEVAKKLNANYSLTLSYMNIGNLYVERKEYEKGKHYLHLSYDTLIKHEIYYLYPSECTSLAELYIKMGEMDKAWQYIEDAKNSKEKKVELSITDEISIMESESLYYEYKEEYEKAEERILKAISMYHGMPNKEGQSSAYEQYAKLLIKMKRIEEAKKYYVEAIKLCREMKLEKKSNRLENELKNLQDHERQ
ncbi:MAG: tetratricopeptide repeat protein [Thermoplasmata archaeon]